MKRIVGTMLGIAALSVLVSLAGDQKRDALRVTLHLNERKYLLHEPMAAVVTLENDGTETIHIPKEVDSLGEQYVTFDILNEKNERIGYVPTEQADAKFYPSDYRGIPLDPGEKYSVWFDLTWQEAGGRTDLVWKRPGTYRVTARYQYRSGLPEIVTRISGSSAAVEALVVDPTGKDKEAHDLLSEGAKPYLWNSSEAQTRNYARLIRQWPESGYAKYARCFLAQKADIQARMNGLDQKSVNAAVKAWLDASRDEPPHAYTYFNQEGAASLLFEAKRYGESAPIWRKLLADREYPDSRRLKAKETLEKMGISANQLLSIGSPRPEA
jgi:hypothetical protein